MLLDAVALVLEHRGIPYALIGGTALAVHGVARSTFDQDLLVTDRRALTRDAWAGLPKETVVDIRAGDADDPLAGVVRCRADADRDVDLVLLKLYAGGSQDRWDIDQLLAIGGRALVDGVEEHLPQLPPASRALWKTISGARS